MTGDAALERGRFKRLMRATTWLVLTASGLVLVVVLFWPVADRIAEHDTRCVSAAGCDLTSAQRVDRQRQARDAARGRIIQVIGGLLVFGTLVYTARRFDLDRREARRQAEESRKALHLTEQGQITDRYTSAIELLGSERIDARIGGIYALERLVADSERDHPTVVEVLTAFVRFHSHEDWDAPHLPSGHVNAEQPRPDVQAALTDITRRNPDLDLEGVNLNGAHVPGAWLPDAKLSGADLNHANLIRAYLSGADLTGASLHAAILVDADLTGADLTGAVLTRANLAASDLTGAYLDSADLTSMHLVGADLRHADLSGATVTDLILATPDGGNCANLDGALVDDDFPLPTGWTRDAGSGRVGQSPSS